MCCPSARARSIAEASSADPTPRRRQGSETCIPISPNPKRLDPTWSEPTISPSATATSVPATSHSAAQSATSTGGSVAIWSRSPATAANSSASANTIALLGRPDNNRRYHPADPRTPNSQHRLPHSRPFGCASVRECHSSDDNRCGATGRTVRCTHDAPPAWFSEHLGAGDEGASCSDFAVRAGSGAADVDGC